METQTFSLNSLEQTQKFGRKLGSLVEQGMIITLGGELGAGKTTLTQAIGEGLAVPATCYITSPTFSLIHEYPGRIPLYHMDLYRLMTTEEIEEIGVLDYLYGKGVAVIEWADKLSSLMPEERLNIELVFVDETSREALLRAYGIKHHELMMKLV